MLPLCRASFELEAGAIGQTTDFKEGSRRLEWNLKKAIASACCINLFLY
jgi:AP-4 complex subunit mu-1